MISSKFRIITLITFFVLSFLTATSFAAFIDNGNTIFDDVNNLEWYKVDLTLNISFDQMETNFANAASPFFNFRYATDAELIDLWSEAGLSVGDNTPSDVADFTELFGQTFSDGQFLLNERNIGNPLNADGWTTEGNNLIFQAAGRISERIPAFPAGNVSGIHGHAIVAPVPEPSTYVLFMTLFGVIGFCYRRKNLTLGDIENS